MTSLSDSPSIPDSISDPDVVHVLIVDDEISNFHLVDVLLSNAENLPRIKLLYADSLKAAFKQLSKTQVHVILLDKNLESSESPEDRNGIDAIPEVLAAQPHLQILIVTGSNAIPDVVRAMNLGAFGYITKDTIAHLIESQLKKAIDMAELKLDRDRRKKREAAAEGLGGKSKIFIEILNDGDRVAMTNRPVLIQGPSGTGKTALAKRIHKRRCQLLNSKDRPFYHVNVAALAEDLIEGELFGTERGGFTDAKDKPGLFELAQSGTLFLDEIGELPKNLQAKLLTAIENGTIMRVGGTKQLTCKPKLIFATQRDLKKMVSEGDFRFDLYKRISNLPIQMPSLSERREDIPDIIRIMLPEICKENNVYVNYDEIPTDFIEFVSGLDLEGNVRDIQHLLDRLLVLSPTDKQGRPALNRWRSNPKIYAHETLIHKATQERVDDHVPLTYDEMMSRSWDIISNKFPGINLFLEEVREKILNEASAKFKKSKDKARALKVSESTMSKVIKSRGVAKTGENGLAHHQMECTQ